MARSLQMTSASAVKGFIHFFAQQPSPALNNPLLAASTVIPGSRRCVHSSVYDKNEDESIRPHLVPDHLIEVDTEKKWVPHPETGVFVPEGKATSEHSASHDKAGSGSGSGSVLEQQVWFRPLEDLQKQPYNN